MPPCFTLNAKPMRRFLFPPSRAFYRGLCLAILLLTLGLLAAQSPQRGNGTLTQETRLSGLTFHQVAVKTYCNVTIRCGHRPRVVVETDANLQAHLLVAVREGLLSIDTDTWIQPSRLQVTVEVPFIHHLRYQGWGHLAVEGLAVETFTLVAPTGTIRLAGQVETLILQAGTGDIDAGALQARRVEVHQAGHGSTLVQAEEQLIASGERGRIRYLGQPALQQVAGSDLDLAPYASEPGNPATPAPYIEVRVRNNRPAKGDFYIAGPPGQRFSYGFPMGPFATRKKVVPPGTQIFEANLLGLRGRCLLTIEAADAGQTLDLYP